MPDHGPGDDPVEAKRLNDGPFDPPMRSLDGLLILAAGAHDSSTILSHRTNIEGGIGCGGDGSVGPGPPGCGDGRGDGDGCVGPGAGLGGSPI
jgi:hypothetical protein